MQKVFFIPLAVLLFFSNCQNQSESPQTNSEKMQQGFAILQNNCFSCHSPDANMGQRLAPPMEAVKRHYISEDMAEEVFTDAIVGFLLDPAEDKSKMPGALQRFGLMPKMSYSEEDYRAIAHYMYHTALEAPEWFEAHYEAEHGKYSVQREGDISYLEKGKNIAMSTKSVLGKNLLGAIQSSGPEGAVTFCNERALPLTDSMSAEQNVSIRRVSDRPRNPGNKAEGHAAEYILNTKLLLASDAEVKPAIREIDNKMVGYYPIMTNAMCLQCHGNPASDINANTLATIDKAYPNDEAKGYGEDELRGIWIIEMEK